MNFIVGIVSIICFLCVGAWLVAWFRGFNKGFEYGERYAKAYAKNKVANIPRKNHTPMCYYSRGYGYKTCSCQSEDYNALIDVVLDILSP